MDLEANGYTINVISSLESLGWVPGGQYGLSLFQEG